MAQRPYTQAQAIAALQAVADRWPQELMLFSAASTLVVVKTDWHADKGMDGPMTDDDVIARIDGIPNDGGDPW